MLGFVVSTALFHLLATQQTAAPAACAQMPYRSQNQVDSRIRASGLQGIALDTQGGPVPGVCVGLFDEPGHVLLVAAQTDDNGRFTLRRPPRGTYRLVTEIDGLGVANAMIRLVWFGPHRFVARMIPRESIPPVSSSRPTDRKKFSKLATSCRRHR